MAEAEAPAKQFSAATKELAENIIRTIGHYNACLMANHGLVCIGNNLPTAFALT